MADVFYMTKQGYEEGVERLKYLQTQKRQEITERIKVARDFGDLSENAEYDAAKNEQAANEGEILELEIKLKNAVIIDEEAVTDCAHIGGKVKVYDFDMDMEEEYTITGVTESDPNNNKISNESPVGQALIGAKVGETVTVKAPGGAFKLKIISID